MTQTVDRRGTTIAEPLDAGVLAETRAFNDRLEELMAGMPSIDEVPPEVTRRVRREGGGIFPPPTFLPEARDLVIEGAGGPLPLRVIAPDEAPTGVYLHFHGGGWTLGAHDMQDPLLRDIVDGTGMTAVSVGYRLGPEHPYPAGPDDCEAALLWLLDRGREQLGAPERVCVGGESAGAHLAAVSLLRLRDRHGGSAAVRGANLVFGCYDLSMTPSQRLWGDRTLVLSDRVMRFFGDCFLPGTPVDARRDPDVSPLFARLEGMPPAHFSVGTLDPLLDDSLFMESRWRAAGNAAELRVWPEAVHGFTAFPLAVSRRALDAQLAFLRAVIA